MSTYKPKYKLNPTIADYPGKPGRKNRAVDWITDRRYAYSKHQAQARFRKEEYAISYEEWCELWPEPQWMARGRLSEDLTMYRVDAHQPWSVNNIVICKNKDKGAYYQEDRTKGGRPKGT